MIPLHKGFFKFWQDRTAWRKACRVTFVCLIGCSIGDFGTIILMQIYYPNVSIFLTMGLAMIAGLMTSIGQEMILLVLKEGLGPKAALTMAFSMSFLSMLGMELAENAADYFLTKGMVHPTEPWYWISLLISLAAGFLAPLPYNYYQFKRHRKTCH